MWHCAFLLDPTSGLGLTTGRWFCFIALSSEHFKFSTYLYTPVTFADERGEGVPDVRKGDRGPTIEYVCVLRRSIHYRSTVQINLMFIGPCIVVIVEE